LTFIIFLAVTWVIPVEAQIQAPRYRVTPQFTDGASSVHAADLDGDGDIDLLSASTRDNKIAWYENFDGQIGSQQIISTIADDASSVYAADLDGDGDLDVLSASADDDKIAWYENLNGTRDFSEEKVISRSANSPFDVFAADLDGDGDMDVLSASGNDDTIAWYENNGSGAFSSEIIITNSADFANSVYAADIDGDGDLDVLSTSFRDDTVAWYENTNGDGAFSAPRVISGSTDGAIHVHAADLDGDGDNDVVSAAHDGDMIAWYENTDGDGTFSAAKVISTTANGAIEVYAVDLDGDNDLEVLSASFDNDSINIYDNQIGESGADADGFGPTVQITTRADGAEAVYAADIDGDGDADILSASWFDDTISYFDNRVNEGAGFPIETIVMPGARADAAQRAVAADLNGDGALDILTASANDDKIAWHANDGTRWFSPQRVIASDVGFPSDVATGDLDGDGDQDVATVSFDDDSVLWFENTDGAGTFSTASVLTTTADGATSVYVADVDGDNDLDILSTSERDDTVSWFENTDGSGTFSAENIIWQTADGANDVVAADIDGDGDMDVAAAYLFADVVAWFENTDGSGSFSNEKIIVASAPGVNDVHPADLDGDGDVDLLYSPGDADVVNWIENTDGAGTFSSPKEITNLVRDPRSIATADVNQDGLLDVITASYDDDEIAWYLQTVSFGVIDFSDQKVISRAAEGAESVFAADMDGDGDIDVLAASERDDEVSWYENAPGSILPVELTTFTASSSGDTVELTWGTASETGNAGFEVERSLDGTSFTTIGFEPGFGTTTEARTYRFTDDSPPFATSLFYRLRQVDVDGTFEFSPVAEVRVTPQAVALLPSAPNPFRQSTRLRYELPETAAVTVQVFDLLGRKVATLADGNQPAGRHELTLDAAGLASGTYFIRLRAGETMATEMVRLVK
jgi:hypothetical protein